jgi:hypothetical protein
MVFEYCAMAIAISVASVTVVGSLAVILGIISVILGKDKD